MKYFFFLITIFFTLISCRNDDRGAQQIDQILNIYIDSAGTDLLNNKIAGSYSSIRWNDVNGLTANAAVNFSTKKNADTVNYLEYLAGAQRLKIDSVGDLKTYESKIALSLTKKISPTIDVIINDTMIVQYKSSPELFQISKVWYNKVLKFTKVQGQPNIVRITK